MVVVHNSYEVEKGNICLPGAITDERLFSDLTWLFQTESWT